MTNKHRATPGAQARTASKLFLPRTCTTLPSPPALEACSRTMGVSLLFICWWLGVGLPNCCCAHTSKKTPQKQLLRCHASLFGCAQRCVGLCAYAQQRCRVCFAEVSCAQDAHFDAFSPSRTPAMGYNTWNDFRCANITAANVMAVADKMIELGLNYAGYQYLNVDDCWCTGRENDTNVLIPDPVAFPNGMKAVADYVHSLVRLYLIA